MSDPDQVFARPAAATSGSDQYCRRAILQHGMEAFGGIPGVQRHIGPSSLQRRQNAHDHLQAAFCADGNTLVGTDTTSPYSISWNSATFTDGSAAITARAVDTSTNQATSAARTMTLDPKTHKIYLANAPGGRGNTNSFKVLVYGM